MSDKLSIQCKILFDANFIFRHDDHWETTFKKMDEKDDVCWKSTSEGGM